MAKSKPSGAASSTMGTAINLDEAQTQLFEKLSAEFDAMSNGFKSADFEKQLGALAKQGKLASLSVGELDKVVKKQNITNTRQLNQDKKRLATVSADLKWHAKLNPFKNKEYKMMKNKVIAPMPNI